MPNRTRYRAPTVLSSNRADVAPTSKKVVKFAVTFSEPVSGVDTTDFVLTKTGTLNDYSVTGFTSVGAVYTISVNTGSGNGTLRLDILNDGTIKGVANQPLASTFASGQVYTVKKILMVRLQGANDGWILESTATGNKGGTFNASATTYRMGDDNARKQYKGVLSFSTGAGLPDNAVITKATLKIKKQAILGDGNPVTLFQGLMVDVRKGVFGASTLQTTDFQALAGKSYGPFKPTRVNG